MQKTIVRYLSGQKFDWLLSDSGLYLSAAENQSDPAEGVYDHALLSRHITESVSDAGVVMPASFEEHMLGLQKVNKKINFLSCWYLGSDESQEMWDEFGENGVIVLSNDWALQDALPRPLQHATSFVEVIYSDELKPLAINKPLQVKNKKFFKEKEFRIVFNLLQYSILTGFEAAVEIRDGEFLSHESEGVTSGISKEEMEQSHKVIRRKGDGFVFNYSLSSIIKEVRVHPRATDEDLQKIGLRLKAAGINCPISHSSLREA
ncbi:hypothetical protein SAMN05443579_117169 [Variovorax sp. PDC80]|uniref:hypothetical protein n=1 Tax=Variovorax sp. PDC80 TaxID=1882827 RepID=UPI0008E939D5|nr:hypothetical protein [Variovorax sp. PDC80]SFP91419.1 hypothetical protein SAMN05443579_117169 [Variovorax sp. PDC80]